MRLTPRLRAAILFAAALLALTHCAKRAPHADPAPEPATAARGAPPAQPALSPPSVAGETANRRVIRTAELSLEADEPDVVQRRVAALAESRGGFVLNADTNRMRMSDGTEAIA